MKQILLISSLLFSLLSFSQIHFNTKNDAVTINDLRLNTYSKDTIANALVIYEYGNSYIDEDDFLLKTEIKRKIKILNREGFNQANVLIHLFDNKNGKEKISNISATTYNFIDEVKSTTILNKKDIYEEKYDENHTLVKFTLPNIKEGSVITYSYTLSSPFKFNYRSWYFQEKIPTLYSEYRTLIPAIYDYNIKLTGAKKLSVNDQTIKKKCLTSNGGGTADCTYSIYAMENVPAFIKEDYTTSSSNYISRIEYELKTFHGFNNAIKNYTKTWKTVDLELKHDKNIGRQLLKKIDLEETLGIHVINEANTLEKAKKIYNYIQDTYTWNEEYHIFKDVSIKKLIEEKTGNVSAINILLHNILKASNIDVKPILMSTRNRGFLTKIFPVISDFNYLIVQAKIDDKTYLLDATDKLLSFGMVPYKCLNGDGRLIDFKKGSTWIDIKPNSASKLFFEANLEIDDSDIISGTITSQRTGYYALRNKKKYYKNDETYIKNLENEFPFVDISDFKITSEGRKNPIFKTEYNVKYKNDETGELIYIAPFLVRLFDENPFKLQERTYPVDFGYKTSYYYTFMLNLNENYTIEALPKKTIVNLPNNTGKITFGATVIGNTIKIILNVTFKQSIYATEYYPYLKSYIGKIVDLQNNSLIVLKKK